MKTAWKVIEPRIKAHRWKIFFSLLFSFAAGLLQSLFPEFFRILVDEAWSKENRELTLVLPVAFVGLWGLINLFRYFQTLWIRKISIFLIAHLQRDLMKKYLRSNFSLLKKESSHSGGLISRLMNDLSQIERGFYMLANLLREPFIVVFTLAYLCFRNVVLTFFMCLVLLLTLWISRKIAKSLKKHGHLNQEGMEKLNATLKESLDGMPVIQAFHLEKKMEQKFREEQDYAVDTKNKVIERETSASPIFNMITALGVSSLLYYVNFLIFQNKFTVGEFTGFLAALIILLNSARKTQDSYVSFQQSVVSLERFDRIIKSSTEVQETSRPLLFPENWSEIVFKNLFFSYDTSSKPPLLRDINFSVKRGERVAIVGASGSGKSTLIHLMYRFLDPQEGEIFIGGVPIRKMSLQDLRKNMALVSQDSFLLKDSIESNIRAGCLDGSASTVQEAAQKAGAHDFIQKFERKYQTLVGEKGDRLSGGEKQRISLARAFFKNAPILILDEPTSALDAESERKVQEGLEELMEGRTTLLITHRSSMISETHKVFLLKQGHLIRVKAKAERKFMVSSFQE